MFNEINATVSCMSSIVMPLIGVVNDIDQLSYYGNSENYLNRGRAVTIIEIAYILFVPVNSTEIASPVFACRIKEAGGWFLETYFQYSKEK